ncbi:MAG: hypothetical protein ACREIQ_04870 [Nitrospiria bacterium]
MGYMGKPTLGKSRYQIGDAFEASYSNPPVPPGKQYRIGQEVIITDADSGVWLAAYVVEKSDDTKIRGRITRVFE